MKSQASFQFTLVLDGVDDQTPGLEDRLFEAGCDDALLHYRHGSVRIDFDRVANSFEDAICSAITDVEASKLPARVVSVGPDDLVSIIDIAKRINLPRQTVSLWVKGERLPDPPFPRPIKRLADKSPFWRWYEVVKWLVEQKKLEDGEVTEQAFVIENLNAVLSGRDAKAKACRNKLAKKLSRS